MSISKIILIILLALTVQGFSKPPVPREIRETECQKKFLSLKKAATAQQRYKQLLSIIDCAEFSSNETDSLLIKTLRTDTSVNMRLQSLIILKNSLSRRYLSREDILAEVIRIAETDPSPDIRFTATKLYEFRYRGLGEYYEVLAKCKVENLESYYEIAKGAQERIIQIDRLLKVASTVSPRLITFINDTTSEQDLRADAVLLLGKIGKAEKRTVPVLLSALNDRNWKVRNAAATAFSYLKIPQNDIVYALVRALEDPIDEVSSSAAIVLGTLPLDSSQISFILPAMLSKLDNGNYLTRINSVRAIGILGNIHLFTSQLIAPLTSILKNERDNDLRIACLFTLSECKEAAASAVPALITLLNVRDGELRTRVVKTLGAIGPLSAPAVSKLINLLEVTYECDLLTATITTLGEIGAEAQVAIPHLKRISRQAGNIRYSECDTNEIKSQISTTLNKIQLQDEAP